MIMKQNHHLGRVIRRKTRGVLQEELSIALSFDLISVTFVFCRFCVRDATSFLFFVLVSMYVQ